MKTLTQTLNAFLMLFISAVSFNANAENTHYGTQKAAYHINYDDAKRQSAALVNIQNHMDAVGAKNVEIRVVMHGNGLSLALKPEVLAEVPGFKAANASDAMTQKIDNLKLQGVKFNVCAKTVKGRTVNVEKHLYDVDASDIVPSGVAEVAHLQGQGFSYMRP